MNGQRFKSYSVRVNFVINVWTPILNLVRRHLAQINEHSESVNSLTFSFDMYNFFDNNWYSKYKFCKNSNITNYIGVWRNETHSFESNVCILAVSGTNWLSEQDRRLYTVRVTAFTQHASRTPDKVPSYSKKNMLIIVFLKLHHGFLNKVSR